MGGMFISWKCVKKCIRILTDLKMKNTTLGMQGYQTGNVYLNGLAISIKLPSGRYFRDDGFVRNLGKHTQKVHKELDPRFSDYTKKVDPQVGGIHVGFEMTMPNGDEARSSVIFLKKDYTTYWLFNKAHEETHALIFLDKEDELIKDLKKHGFYFDPFKHYSDEESIAHVGGFLGLFKQGIFHKMKHDNLINIREYMLSTRKPVLNK